MTFRSSKAPWPGLTWQRWLQALWRMREEIAAWGEEVRARGEDEGGGGEDSRMERRWRR